MVNSIKRLICDSMSLVLISTALPETSEVLILSLCNGSVGGRMGDGSVGGIGHVSCQPVLLPRGWFELTTPSELKAAPSRRLLGN